MIGQVVSHDQIPAKLGDGGKCVVRKAHDTKLGRIVELKFLPPRLSSTYRDGTRSTREARTAAAPAHPRACHICEVDAPPAGASHPLR